jgi:hypothetical protein
VPFQLPFSMVQSLCCFEMSVSSGDISGAKFAVPNIRSM